jgi:glutathione S-transferase
MLRLHYHPLASFAWKVLIALYESDIGFERNVVDLGDPQSAGAFRQLWPMAKMPVLEDEASREVVPEASIIIEYLGRRDPRAAALLPVEPEAALETRLRDRFYDLYVHQPMQKIVTDRFRPDGRHDPEGVEEARRTLRTAYGTIEDRFVPSPWAAGEEFSLADCAAAPSLFYADKVEPFAGPRPVLGAYLDRLRQRPSFARVLEEAEPYFSMFPG